MLAMQCAVCWGCLQSRDPRPEAFFRDSVWTKLGFATWRLNWFVVRNILLLYCGVIVELQENICLSLPSLTQQQWRRLSASQATTCGTPHKAKSTNLFKVPSQRRNFLHTYLISNNTNLRTESKTWVPLFLVSMDHRVLDTQLHTRFAIFLYALRLETAMLTKLVPLDAADAERFVLP